MELLFGMAAGAIGFYVLNFLYTLWMLSKGTIVQHTEASGVTVKRWFGKNKTIVITKYPKGRHKSL